MKKKIIFFLILIFFCCYCSSVFGKYKLEYELKCFEIVFNKDKEPPEFDVIYSTKEWTNSDVIVKVIPSENVQKIDGFNYNNGVYERIVSSNESKEIKVFDLAGNVGYLKYVVDNIDKIPPSIIGVENNGKYNEKKEVKYIDNDSQIEKIQKIYYGDLLIDSNSDYYNTSKKLGIDVNRNSVTIKVLRAPKNIINYKYYRIDSEQENYILSKERTIKFNNLDKKKYKYYVIATDINGNIFKSNIIERTGSYFENIKVNKNKFGANISLIGTESIINKIKYKIISLDNDIIKTGDIINNELEFNKSDFNNSNKYKIELEFFAESALTDTRNLYINLNENYIKENDNIFTKSGNYDIIVTDKAGNVSSYTISLEIE